MSICPHQSNYVLHLGKLTHECLRAIWNTNYLKGGHLIKDFFKTSVGRF